MKDKLKGIAREVATMTARPCLYQIERHSMLTGLMSDIREGKSLSLEQLAFAGGCDELTVGSIKAASEPFLVPGLSKGRSVAIVSVRGMALFDLEWQPFAFSTRLLEARMKRLAADESVGAIILDINSPGGVVSGVTEAADAIFEAAKVKTVIASVSPLAASAAYWLASQATTISLVPSGEVGSIGVFMLHVDLSEMLIEAGIKPTFIFSGDNKTAGNQFEPLSEEAREKFQSEVNQIHGEFINAVARGRGLSANKVRTNFGDGFTLLAKDAKAAGMVDRVESADNVLSRAGIGSGGRKAESIMRSGAFPEDLEDDDTLPLASDIESIPMNEAALEISRDGDKVFADSAFPQAMNVTTAFLEGLRLENKAEYEIEEDGSIKVQLLFDNGSASYKGKDISPDEAEGKTFRLTLGSATWKPPGETDSSAEGDEAETSVVVPLKMNSAARKRRLAIQRAR